MRTSRQHLSILTIASLLLGMIIATVGSASAHSVGVTACPTAICVLDNGALRFGNGSENSVNDQGMFQQPFYYSSSGGGYKQLTFSNYPLDMSIGTGSAGTNWSGNTILEVTNGSYASSPVSMSNQTIDYSGFVVSSTLGSISKGYGTIVVTGSFTVNNQNVTVMNTFTLGRIDSFVKIDTKLTNNDSNPLNNLHIWVGTRDDYVGNSDVPTKTRGNLSGTGGSFQAITNQSDQAQAIQITTPTEGALFYSTTAGANTAINRCCLFSNATEQNPATSQISLTNDGSYAAVLPAGDIAPGANTRITWFYAAGSIANLNSVAQAVAAAAAPPVPTVVRGDQSAVVTWEAPTTADPIVSYEVRYSTNNGGSWTTYSTAFAANATSGSVTGLTNGATYVFQVRAVTSNDGGSTTANGDWSGSSTPSTLATPDAPSALSAQGGDSQVSVSFTAANSPVSPVTSYEYSVDGGTTWSTTSPALPTSPVTITGLTNGQNYTIKLRAVNAVGNGYVATLANVLTKPTWSDSVLNPTIRVNVAYSDGVVAGSTVTNYSVASGSLPAGISLNSGTGALTGTPTSAASYSFTLRATNAAGTVDLPVTLTVLPPSPAWTDQTLAIFTAGDPYSDGVVSTYATEYSIFSGSLPSGITLNTVTGTLSGTPTQSNESYSFTIKASAPGGQVTKAFSGTVRLTRPVWTDTTFGLPRAGQQLDERIVAEAAASYAITSGALPSGLSFNTSTGALTGTPTVGGPYSFTVSATNSTGTTAYVFSGFISFPSTPIVQANGASTQVAPGATQVLENGSYVAAVLQVLDQGVQLHGLTFNLNVQAQCTLTTCAIQRDASGNPVLTVDRTGKLVVQGDGFAPNSLVDAWIYSTPTFLGTVIVGPNGEFSGEFDLAALGLEEGSHTLQASGITSSGEQRVANLGIKMQGLELGYTSAKIDGPVNAWFALFLVMFGLALLFLRSYRRELSKLRTNE